MLLTVLAHAVLAMQGKLSLKVKDYMTVTEFQEAGLTKLTPAEIAALDRWFSNITKKLIEIGASPSAPKSSASVSTAATLDFANLEGATIIAEDGQFLGKITANTIDSQSIINDIGRYGSEISSSSIRNSLSRYGSTISPLSAFNEIATDPPRIYKKGQFVAYLSTNNTKLPRVDPRALIGWLQSQK